VVQARQAGDQVVAAGRQRHGGDVGQQVADPAGGRRRRRAGGGEDLGGPVDRIDLDAPLRQPAREPAGPAAHVQRRAATRRQPPQQQPVVMVVVIERHRALSPTRRGRR
jgi:hypothetical protein